ncbi:hypothetical protein MWU50_04395 [Flavobacteriaceae bacterium S0862]|nr:hypothetical protein [Flavobacteriaceae bacterium S0862]
MKNFYTKTVILSIGFFVTIFSSHLFAQKTINNIPVLDSLEIAKSVYYFNITDDLLKGNGANILKEHIASSKFFVLGENHYSNEISKLTKSLVPILNESGYKVVAFEVGPLSAEKLKELSQIPDATEARLKAFNGKYFNSTWGTSAIPFFNGVSDAAFLKAFAETNMEIWGIDQELLFSVLFLGDDLVQSKSNEPNYEDIKAAWTKAKALAKAEFEKMPRKVLTKIFTHPDFQQFEKMFDSDDIYAQEVLKRLYETKHIYESHHKIRVDYINSNFLSNYLAFEEKHEDARYFIKIGSIHAATNARSRGYYDVGALTQEIANAENAKTTNVMIPRATHEGNDYRDVGTSLINFYEKDRWTLIDLKKLRNDLNSNKFQIITHPEYRELSRTIQGFDLILIPPADHKQVPNR